MLCDALHLDGMEKFGWSILERSRSIKFVVVAPLPRKTQPMKQCLEGKATSTAGLNLAVYDSKFHFIYDSLSSSLRDTI